MSDYVPTPAFVEREYVTGRLRRSDVTAPEARAEFARMIAEVERAAAEKAWDEGESAGQHNAGDGFASLLSGVEPPAPRINQYRAEAYRQERKEQ